MTGKTSISNCSHNPEQVIVDSEVSSTSEIFTKVCYPFDILPRNDSHIESVPVSQQMAVILLFFTVKIRTHLVSFLPICQLIQ